MEDLFKKFIYTGVGWISNTTEKLKNDVENFIKEGKISADDGKKILDDFIKNTESKKEEIEDQFNKLLDKLLKSMSFVKSDDLKKLEKRVSNLEALAAKKNEKKKDTINKKTTKPKAGKTTKNSKKT